MLLPIQIPYPASRGFSLAWLLAVADPGRGPGRPPPPPPLFLDQNEAQRAEKKFFEAVPRLSQDLDDMMAPPPLPPPLSEGLDPPLLSVYEVIRVPCLRRVNKPKTRSPKTTAKLI